jgi:hypothetical protein
MPRQPAEVRRNLRTAAEHALKVRFGLLRNVELDDKGRSAEMRSVLSPEIGGPELDAALSDVKRGAGGELRPTKKRDGSYRPPPLHSVYGSCGLALSCFAPWRLDPTSLWIASHGAFNEIRLEVKLPIRGIPETDEPPNLDVGASSDDRVLVIESKLTEHLDANHVAQFQEKYKRAILYAEPSWRAFYESLLDEAEKELGRRFHYVHVGQLVRHYLGLASQLVEKGIYEGRRGTLLYLYWEPDDAETYRACRTHRDEVLVLQEAVSDPDISFEAISYRELWRSWEEASGPPWLIRHASYLEARYGVSLSEGDGFRVERE